MATATAKKDGVVHGGKEIATTNRLYIDLKGYGCCDGKGKSVLGIGTSGRLKAEPDKPLATLLLPLIDELLPLCRYSTDEAMEADLAAVKHFAETLAPRPKAAASARP